MASLDDLTTIWIQADSNLRKSITAATNGLDQILKSAPFDQSESRGDNDRILFVSPLGAVIEVDDVDHIVWVLSTWLIRRRTE